MKNYIPLNSVAIENSSLTKEDKIILSQKGFPTTEETPILYGSYEPFSNEIKELSTHLGQGYELAFDKLTEAILLYIPQKGIYFYDSENKTSLDFLNTSLQQFYDCMDSAFLFFKNYPVFIDEFGSDFPKNAKQIIKKLKAELKIIDKMSFKDENSGWSVFIEELEYLID
mgnify:CR=1 FL=1